ncbi:hypothetical protein GCM10009430_32640 [Aquimarina litoralis]|uniref:G8 domain-containing protein n=1 Tax=Aquimarina litoralis TaxID=584605 RepID=A0ABN1J1Q9_9FLAO
MNANNSKRRWSFKQIYILFLLFSVGINAQQLWSDPETWNGDVPKTNENITIPQGKTILLDVSTPNLGNIIIKGKLMFKQGENLNLTAKTILIDGGVLEIGTVQNPYRNKAIITLNGPKKSGDQHNSRFIMPMNGGTLELHGISARYLDWSQINKNALKGQNSLLLKDEPKGWKAGDKIVIASSSFDPEEAEKLTITNINGKTVNFTPALKYDHYGKLQQYEGKTLDERAEVGLLTRNIVIKGSDDSRNSRMGGHIMVMPRSNARIEGVELYQMGQVGEKARYPIHWHFSGTKVNNYAKHNSVHNSYHRGIVVHRTNNVLVERNVAYNILSHTFVPAEDGTETGNSFYYNLGILTKRLEVKDFAFPNHTVARSNQSEHRPGTFWLKNPLNELVGNHAAGTVQGMGFFYDHSFNSNEINQIVNSITEPIVFRDNVAHSNSSFNRGLDVYGPTTRGYGIFSNDRSSKGERLFENFTVYKNSLSGTWIEGKTAILRNCMSADNNTGHMLMQNLLEDSIIVGQSDNEIGGEAPTQGVYHVSGAIQLIAHGGPKRPSAKNVTIIDQRYAAVVGADKEMLSNSFTENIKQINVVKPFWYRNSEVGGGFEDKDGSLTGHSDSFIVSLKSKLKSNKCIYKKEWRAYICPREDYNVAYFEASGRKSNDFSNLTLVSSRHSIKTRGGKEGLGRSKKNQFSHIFGDSKYVANNDKAWSKEFQVSMELQPSSSSTITLKNISSNVTVLLGNPEENQTALNKVRTLRELEQVNKTSYFYDNRSRHLHLKFVYDPNVSLQQTTIKHNGKSSELNQNRELDLMPIEVYPNPLVENTTNISLPVSVTSKMNWKLYDITGRIIETGNLNDNQSQIRFKPLSKGLYVLRVFNELKTIAQVKLGAN